MRRICARIVIGCCPGTSSASSSSSSGIEPGRRAEADADGAEVDDLALHRTGAATPEPDGARVAAAAEAALAVDREHRARAQPRVRPGARRLDPLDAQLHEGDAAACRDAHRDRHARHERPVGAGHVDAGAVHALDPHLHAPPEGGHGLEHAAGHEQLWQLGQDRGGRRHESHASAESGRDKRQSEQAQRLPAGICAKPSARAARSRRWVAADAPAHAATPRSGIAAARSRRRGFTLRTLVSHLRLRTSFHPCPARRRRSRIRRLDGRRTRPGPAFWGRRIGRLVRDPELLEEVERAGPAAGRHAGATVRVTGRALAVMARNGRYPQAQPAGVAQW